MFYPRGAFVARQFRFRNDCASWRGAFPARLEHKRQFVVNWTLCAPGFFSCSHGKFATRPFAGRGAPADLTRRENAGFPQQKRRTTRSVDPELGFRFPEDVLDYKFRKVRLLMSSNFGKVQYHMPIKFGKVYSIELAAHKREEYDARQKSEGAVSVLARFIAK